MKKVTQYADPEAETLKVAIKNLELEINFVSDEIADVEKLIHDFGIRNSNELGDLIIKLLKVRKEKLEREQNGTETKKREFDEAKNEYEQYSKQHEENISEKQVKLTEEEKQELKTKYRKASKLCHPDVVTDEFKAQAEIVFKELQTAYEQNDLKKVIEILKKLEKGDMFIHKSEGINVITKLKSEMINLRNKLTGLKNNLNELKNSETYQTIIKIADWDEYFKLAKEKLIHELKTKEK